jgi:hypothetical protein
MSQCGLRTLRKPQKLLQVSAAIFGGLLLFGLLSSPASAQISPGPLARPHSSLNGPTNCTECHQLSRGEPAFRCLNCHREIANRLDAHKGLHASYNMKPGSSQECAKCHSDHNGEDFPLVKWDIKTFDHKQTGYALEGKHAGLECAKCHTPDHISAAERATIKVKDLAKTYLGVSLACTTCHEDKHKGRLGPNCLQCHNYNDWKSVTVSKGGNFDHSKTRYPLTGQHAQVACAKCHTPGADGQPRYTGIPFGKCLDCHEDPHRGSFTQTCETCHRTSGWKNVIANGLNSSFDHSKTKYPLEGKHKEISCTACHSNGDFKKPLAFAKCTDCHHPDPHSGQFARRPDKGECSACHNLNGFKPSTFGLPEHQKTQYPLKGGHAKLQCGQCHTPKGKDTVYKLKFAHCTDCHKDEHGGQFAGPPYVNDCERCHTLDGYRPSTFTLTRHKDTQFPLTGGHIAVACGDCHKESAVFKPKATEQYHWQNLACTACHEDPHKHQFDERMRQPDKQGKPLGCQLCHSTKSWKDLSGFDHDKTSFPLLGTHRATGCIDCHKPPRLQTRLIDVDFKAAPTKCEDCHEDPHGKQFTKNGATPCEDCHNSARWKPSLFDHDKRTSFSLQGAHMNVVCEGCHKLIKTVDGKKVLFYKPTPKECSDCHGADIKKPK